MEQAPLFEWLRESPARRKANVDIREVGIPGRTYAQIYFLRSDGPISIFPGHLEPLAKALECGTAIVSKLHRKYEIRPDSAT